ncbi:type 4a pilus biogenesis protein PilO [[Clostridium] dakarense]|uniref:type 4a pilus biogenesis protein PilO n=1 Tax=Faecalimicrobium dakarense TaxID=1301100 RepID=UPI0004B22E5A|nr:type 4a pilus biogenesis protein PilO [[Clostridium] dakarense]
MSKLIKESNKEVEDKKSIWQTDIKDLFKTDILKKEVSAKGLLVTLGVVLILGLYGYFFVFPKFTQFMKSKNNLESSLSELNGYKQELEELPVKQEKLDSLTREAKAKSRQLSHDMEDGLFLIGLDKIMKSLDIKLNNYQISDSVNYTNFYAIPMSLNVEGDYRRIRELIYYLEEQKNITQVMDYNMSAKMTEVKKETAKRVYWTIEDTNYHLDKECKNMLEGNVLYGTPTQSGGRKPDPDCVGDASNTIDVKVTSKASGDISANIDFIVYSSDKDIIKLETDNPATWKHGKYNPFQDTLN